MDFTSRLLDFPVRTAAVQALLADLKARRIGDIAALQAVIGDSALWDDILAFWLGRGWIRAAPSSSMHVFPGDHFSETMTLREFCGDDVREDRSEDIPE